MALNGRDEVHECDVLVVGSGAAGMSAAVTARHRGLNVLIVEKEPRFGGTTARSGGWLWIPGTSLARAWGIDESAGRRRAPICGTRPATVSMRRGSMRSLRAGPEAVDFFTTKTAVALRHAAGISGLSRRGARRRAGRPLDGDATVRRPRTRHPYQEPRRAAAGTDGVRHDARLRQGDHPFHARDASR